MSHCYLRSFALSLCLLLLSLLYRCLHFLSCSHFYVYAYLLIKQLLSYSYTPYGRGERTSHSHTHLYTAANLNLISFPYYAKLECGRFAQHPLFQFGHVRAHAEPHQPIRFKALNVLKYSSSSNSRSSNSGKKMGLCAYRKHEMALGHGRRE